MCVCVCVCARACIPSVCGDLPLYSVQQSGSDPGSAERAALEQVCELWRKACCSRAPLHLLFSELALSATLSAGHTQVTPRAQHQARKKPTHVVGIACFMCLPLSAVEPLPVSGHLSGGEGADGRGGSDFPLEETVNVALASGESPLPMLDAAAVKRNCEVKSAVLAWNRHIGLPITESNVSLFSALLPSLLLSSLSRFSPLQRSLPLRPYCPVFHALLLCPVLPFLLSLSLFLPPPGVQGEGA